MDEIVGINVNNKNINLCKVNTNKYKTLGLAVLCGGMLLNPISQAMAAAFSSNAVAESESQYWSSYKLEVQNSGTESADLRNAVIEFVLPEAVSNIGWTSNHVSYPSLSIEHTPTQSGVLHSIKVNFPQGSWVDSSLDAGEKLAMTLAESNSEPRSRHRSGNT